MMTLDDFTEKYSTLRSIRRFNMMPTIRTQDLCGHGYGVGCIFFLLCKEFDIEISAELLFLVMNHDFVESYTGDLNKIVKMKNEATQEAWSILESESVPPNLRGFTDKVLEAKLEAHGPNTLKVFQLADCMDAGLYCMEEIKLGNLHLEEPYRKYQKWVETLSAELQLSMPGRVEVREVMQ